MERRFGELLSSKDITFKDQKKFGDCRHKRELVWDFFFLDDCVCDLDGRQHFESVLWASTQTDIVLQKKKDAIKNEWARKTNKHLLRISYSEATKMQRHFDQFLLAVRSAGYAHDRVRVELFFGVEYGSRNCLTM